MIKIHAIYFSATGCTRKVVEAVAKGISEGISNSVVGIYDFTLPQSRLSIPVIEACDVAVVGTPVYAGRIPNLLLKYMQALQGNGAVAVPVVTYGNRNFDDALTELKDLLSSAGFRPSAAAAFVGQHSFSDTLAKGRPNADDISQAKSFGKAISQIDFSDSLPFVAEKFESIPGRDALTKVYYQPRYADGTPIDIRKVKPLTNDSCTACGHCADVCPMGAIDTYNPKLVTGICIKCNACLKECPVGAKYLDDPGYLYHKSDLEQRYQEFKFNRFFL